MEEKNQKNSIQENSPAGEFLQSEDWRKFQESVGRKTFHLSTSPHPSPYKGEGAFGFWANIVEHQLPIIGKYFYVPHGPISNFQFPISNQDQISKQIQELVDLAKSNNAGWIRIEPETEELLGVIKKNTKYKIAKAPHDVQPKEVFVIDISKSEEELLGEMKAKTRYNIKLSQKHNVLVKVISNFQFPISNQAQNPNDKNFKFYVDEFIRLTRVMAKRQGITAHPENYYRKMLETIPGDNLKLYVAEYEGKIIAANLVVFYGDTCTYLHGASDDNFRKVMAPYLLQWRQIQDAKKAGCVRYDFGGVASAISNFQFSIFNQIPNPNDKNTKQNIPDTKYQILNTKWGGITKFKLGFSPKTLPTVFPGSFDIIISPQKYWLYRTIQQIKKITKL